LLASRLIGLRNIYSAKQLPNWRIRLDWRPVEHALPTFELLAVSLQKAMQYCCRRAGPNNWIDDVNHLARAFDGLREAPSVPSIAADVLAKDPAVDSCPSSG
jgi:hypothetical protein